MLANQYIEMKKASKHKEHVCTGWQGFDDDHRMLCTVAEAITRLEELGIKGGVLAIVRLGTKVVEREDLRASSRGVGRVVGVSDGLLDVDWERGPRQRISHHLVVFANPDEQIPAPIA